MDTVLESLIASLRARNVAPDGQAPPAAIVWTDPKREWLPLVDMFLEHVEEYLVLGEYDAERRTGPAVWLRCIVDGTLEQPRLPRDRPPIVYVPGVARQDLRAGEECPDRLKPLVELLYRGALWHHPNGGDWTVNAFLTSRTALGLDVAGDRTTADAPAAGIARGGAGSGGAARGPTVGGRRLRSDARRATSYATCCGGWETRTRPVVVWERTVGRLSVRVAGRSWISIRSMRPTWSLARGWHRATACGRPCGHGSPRRPSAMGTSPGFSGAANPRAGFASTGSGGPT